MVGWKENWKVTISSVNVHGESRMDRKEVGNIAAGDVSGQSIINRQLLWDGFL